MGEYRRTHQPLSECLVWDWLDRRCGGLTGGNSGPNKERQGKNRQHTKQQMCAGEWPCLWQCCDVNWDRDGSNAWLPVVGVMWDDARKTRKVGVGDWTQAFFSSHSTPSLYLSFSHMYTHKHPQSVPFHFPHSVNLICLTMLPPTFLCSLILSCPFSIPFSLIFFPTPALSSFPLQALSLSRSAEQRAWVWLHTSLQTTDKNSVFSNCCRMERWKRKRTRDGDKRIKKKQETEMLSCGHKLTCIHYGHEQQ